MFNRLKTKLNNMSTKDWVVASLWLLTFALLIAFVIIAATVSQTDGTEPLKHDAVLKDNFVLPVGDQTDITGIGVTHTLQNGDTFKTLEVVIDPNDSTNIHFVGWLKLADGVKVLANDTYAMLLASFGLVFGFAIFTSLIVTVAFAYQKKRGNK
ncbi:MAG: hypothetical protein HRT99_01345 [Mycoplasmatales bacterium]|nr:hypothetical protein [Mycoplasmatales bacterium]